MKRSIGFGLITALALTSSASFGLGLDMKRDQIKNPYTNDEVAQATMGGSIGSSKSAIQMVCVDTASTDLSNCKEFRFAMVERFGDENAETIVPQVSYGYEKFRREDFSSWKNFKSRLKYLRVQRDLGVTEDHLRMKNALHAAAAIDLVGAVNGNVVLAIALAVPMAPFAGVGFIAGMVYDILALPEGIFVKVKMNRFLKSIVKNDSSVRVKLNAHFLDAENELRIR